VVVIFWLARLEVKAVTANSTCKERHDMVEKVNDIKIINLDLRISEVKELIRDGERRQNDQHRELVDMIKENILTSGCRRQNDQ